MSTNDRRERPSAAALTTVAADLWFSPERWRRRSGAWFRLSLVATILVGVLAYLSWRGIWSHPSQVELRAEELLARLFVSEVEIEAIAAAEARDSNATRRDERDGVLRSVTVAMPRETRSVRSAGTTGARASAASNEAAGDAGARGRGDGNVDVDVILAAERIVPLSLVDRSSVPPGRRFRGRIEDRPSVAYRIDRVTVDLGHLGLDRLIPREEPGNATSTKAPGIASVIETPPALRHGELAKLLEGLEAELEVDTLEVQGLQAIGIETTSPLVLRHVRSVSTGEGWIVQGAIAEGPFGRSGEVEIWIEQQPLRVVDVSVTLRDVESKLGLDRFLPRSARDLWRRVDPRGRFDIALDVHVDGENGDTRAAPAEKGDHGEAGGEGDGEAGLVGGVARTESASVTSAAAREDDGRRAVHASVPQDAASRSLDETSAARAIDRVRAGDRPEVVLESTHFDSVIRAPAKGEIELEGFDGRIRIETGRAFARLAIAAREEVAQAQEQARAQAQPRGDPTIAGASCRLFGMEGILRGALDRDGGGGLELELRARTVGELPRGRLPPAVREVLDALRPKGVIEAARIRLEESGASAEFRIADVEIAGELGLLIPRADVRLEETDVLTGRGSISVAGLSWARWAGKVTGPDPAVRIEWKPGKLVIEGSEIVVDNTSLAGPPAKDAPKGKLDFRFVGDLEGKTFRGEGGWTQLLLDTPPLTASSVDGEFRASTSPPLMSEGGDPTTPEAKARGVVRAVGLTLPQAGPEGESLSFRTSDASWWLEPEGDVRLRARFAADGRVLRAHGRIAPNGGLDVRCLLETGGKVEESAPRPLDSFEVWNAVEPAAEHARGAPETGEEAGAANAQAGTTADAQTQPEIRAWRLTGTLLAPVAEPITPAEWPESEPAPAR